MLTLFDFYAEIKTLKTLLDVGKGREESFIFDIAAKEYMFFRFVVHAYIIGNL